MENGQFKKRAIFKYEVQGQARFGDPLAIRRTLELILGGDLQNWCNDCHAPEVNVRLKAYEKLRIASCEAFKLGKPFDESTGEGVLDDEWIAVVNSFTGWLEKNEQSAANMPKPSRPAETTSDAPSPT